jgi:hypothetical protein
MARKRNKERPGEILGIGDAASSSVRGYDAGRTRESEQEHRRRRMSEGADEVTSTASGTTPRHGSGATGIDMGSGGEGTDVE